MKKIITNLFIILFIISLSGCQKNSSEQEIPEKPVAYEVPEGYKEDYKNYNYYYYPQDDLTGNSGFITVYAYESDLEYSKGYLEDIEKQHIGYNLTTIKPYSTPKYKGLYYVISNDLYDVISYDILSGTMIVYVVGVDYHIYPNFQKDIKSIVDSLDI